MRWDNHFTVKPSSRKRGGTAFDLLRVHRGQLASQFHSSAQMANGKAGEHTAIQPFAFNKAVNDDTASRVLCAHAPPFPLLPPSGRGGLWR